MMIEEAFGVKHEDTEEQTGWFSFSKLNSVVIKMLCCTEMNNIFEEWHMSVLIEADLFDMGYMI